MKTSPNVPELTNAVLQQVDLFKGLNAADMDLVRQAAAIKKMGHGEFYFFQGDAPEKVYLLLDGVLKLTQTNEDGQQVVIRLIRPVTLFGVVAITRADAYPVNAEGSDDCTAVWWSSHWLMEQMAKIPQLAVNALGIMAVQVQEFQGRFRELATERVERRLARTILRLASQTGVKTAEGVLINLPITRQDLAEMTGTTLFTVSRTLSAWESKGLVAVGRERVVVKFPHGLVRIADDLP